MGFYCVDNLPVELIPIFAELHAAGEGDFARAALLVDAREGLQLEKLPPLLKHLKKNHPITLVFIEANEDALLRRIEGLLTYLIPHYIREGKSYLTIAFGCTGGKHRSVMLAESVKDSLVKRGFSAKVIHRDIDK